MNWIAATEALPPQGVYVLACDVNCDPPECFILAYNYTGSHADGFWSDPQHGRHGTITHWMPLPDPPLKAEEVLAIKGVADSIMSHFLPGDTRAETFSFVVTVEGKEYRAFYQKDAEGYWEFNRYE